MTFMRVDFPEPDGPMIATISPSSISNETPLERANLDLAHLIYLRDVFQADHGLSCYPAKAGAASARAESSEVALIDLCRHNNLVAFLYTFGYDGPEVVAASEGDRGLDYLPVHHQAERGLVEAASHRLDRDEQHVEILADGDCRHRAETFGQLNVIRRLNLYSNGIADDALL